MTQPMRLPTGGLVDRTAPLPFTFDGRPYTGFHGDTLASALLANGVRLLGRSFKYHRPRGLVAAGPEEPNALVTLGRGGEHEPNLPATTIPLTANLNATSQNRWPGLALDLMAVNGLAGSLLSAGFYYKTFMWPAPLWERLYEPLIRRAAGLGRAPAAPDPHTYARGHRHTDVLVIGAGPAGLAAALAAARAGARTILADTDPRFGGRLLSDPDPIDHHPGPQSGPQSGPQPGPLWAETATAELRSMPHVTLMPRTTVFGAYDQGTYGAIEHHPPGAPHRQTYWRIVARRCVLAAGAHERPLVFPGNDRPGIMLAAAARTYITRHAAKPGHRAILLTAGNDHRTIAALRSAGIEVAAILSQGATAHPDILTFPAARITATRGRHSLRAVHFTDAQGHPHRIEADLLCMAGGWTPNLALATHTGHRPTWSPRHNAFLPTTTPPGMTVAGSAAGTFALAGCLAEGHRQGAEAAAATAHTGNPGPIPQAAPATETNPPIWLPSPLPGSGRGRGWVRPGHDRTKPSQKAFVDFQHDVTQSDIALAHREGFQAPEHLKRYTTLGMATDQGKLSNLNGLALMARHTGIPLGTAGTATTVLRPPYTPITLGALAGHAVGPHFRPTRHLPAHRVAAEHGASFMNAGAWVRPAFFPQAGEDWLAAANRESLAVRTECGVCDVSTLGKIELAGPDVGAFLDRLYTNTLSTLAPGRVRYGLMLREDGFVLDDGTVARLAPGRWLLTTTTAQAATVLAHMEFCHQVLWPGLRLHFATVTDQWAQFSLAGPLSRDILAATLQGDVSNEAIPYMACATLRFAPPAGPATTARLFRISFSGERAYEIAVPARQGPALLGALLNAGPVTPYGLEALNVLRIEKGHPAGSELNGTVTAPDLGLARMMSTKKDYIGRALARRPALTDPDRPTLVGLRPTVPGHRLRGGAHLLTPGPDPAPEHDQGWITSATHSPTLGGWIALALIRNGPARHGERLRLYDPIRRPGSRDDEGHDPAAEAEIVPPCFLDPQGTRLHG